MSNGSAADWIKALMHSLGTDEPTTLEHDGRKYLLLGKVPMTADTPAGLYFAVKMAPDGKHIEVPSPVVVVQHEQMRERQDRGLRLVAYDTRMFAGHLAGVRMGDAWNTAFVSRAHTKGPCAASPQYTGLPPRVREQYSNAEVPLPPLEDLLCSAHRELVQAADEINRAAMAAVEGEDGADD